MNGSHESDISSNPRSLGDGERTPEEAPPDGQQDARFPRELRLRTRDDFRRVYERRRSVADQNLIVYGLRNEHEFCRLGLSVSRKVGGAVVRNRWKRRLREAFRTSKQQLPAGLDLIVIPRARVLPEVAALRESLVRLARQVASRLTKDRA